MNNKRILRKLYSSVRNGISVSEKSEYDKRILSNFVNSSFFTNYDVFLVYVSVKDEADTIELIRLLLKESKTVAVPYCSGNQMHFCVINSIDDLIIGKFGIPTVKSPVFINNSLIKKSVCVVPALSIDKNGNRLGYGGGYYDRFLSAHHIETVALCYERCISDFLPTEDFDIPIRNIITENKFVKL